MVAATCWLEIAALAHKRQKITGEHSEMPTRPRGILRSCHRQTLFFVACCHYPSLPKQMAPDQRLGPAD